MGKRHQLVCDIWRLSLSCDPATQIRIDTDVFFFFLLLSLLHEQEKQAGTLRALFSLFIICEVWG